MKKSNEIKKRCGVSVRDKKCFASSEANSIFIFIIIYIIIIIIIFIFIFIFIIYYLLAPNLLFSWFNQQLLLPFAFRSVLLWFTFAFVLPFREFLYTLFFVGFSIGVLLLVFYGPLPPVGHPPLT
jgi:hypothetical protein